MTPSTPAQPGSGEKRGRVSRLGLNPTWLIFLAALLLIVALWSPVKSWINWRFYQPSSYTGAMDATSFVALAYEGVSDRPTDVSPERFDAQLKLLRQNGYVPIGLEEVRAFYEQGKPLPSKAILTTFEQSRKSSYFDTRPIMRQNRWKAVMFVWGKPIREEDPSVLRWPYLKDMVMSRSWEVGGQGDDAFRSVPADPGGRAGNFMSTPMWLAVERRYETPEEFGRRLEADVKANFNEITAQVGVKPLAYAYPYGDFGQYDSRAVLTRRLNLDLVGKYYPLAFLHGPMALNTSHSDPRHLNRLLVDPKWTPEELLARLERSWPVRREFRTFLSTLDTAWVTEWGVTEAEPNRLVLRAAANTTGAKIWLAGSDLLQNYQTRLDFTLVAGQFGCFLRAMPDGETHINVSVDDSGQVWVRQKFSGVDDFTLASGHVAIPADRRCTLEITLRENLCFVRFNGELIGPTVIRLRGRPEPGMLGLSAWTPEKGRARMEIRDLTIVNQAEQLIQWKPILNRGPDLAWWINHNADRMTCISPPWAEVTLNGLQLHPTEDIETLHNLSKVNLLPIYPSITISSETGLETIQPARLVRELQQGEFDGLFLDFSPLERPSIAKITQWVKQIEDILKPAGMRLLVRFPPMVEKTTSFPTVMDVMPDVGLVTATNSQLLAEEAFVTNAVYSSAQVPVPVQDLDLSLYYEVTGLVETNRKYSKDVQVEMLRQRGFAAFGVGDFEESMRCWNQWLEITPRDPEALMLTGDTFLRMQEPTKALESYNQSLDENPGQINLALRRAELLDTMNRAEESRVALNLYARLFPNNIDVLLAQADWLNRRNRREDALMLVKRAISAKPDDLKGLIRYQLMEDDREQRFANVRRIQGIGATQSQKDLFADLLDSTELLSAPEAGILMPFIMATATNDPDDRIRRRFAKMLPPESIVVENFIEEGKVSDHWISSSGEIPTRLGRLYLRAESPQTEVYLRLIGSEGLRNAFVESSMEDIQGFFWLYARRGPTSMIRFGFERAGLYLQVWKNGNLLANEIRPWHQPEGSFSLRLEVVGDGAMGYLNGKAAFDAPVTVPSDLPNGWWGISPYSPQPGQAQVVVKALAAGPLPVYLALPNTAALKDGDQLLDEIKDGMRTLSAVCPPWFRQSAEGLIIGTPGPELAFIRMFTQYHRKRLMPVVHLAYNSTVTSDWLIQTANRYHFNGFVLTFREMPSEEWLSTMRKKLENSDLCVLAMETTPDVPSAKIRELTVLHGLFQPTRTESPISLIPYSYAFASNRIAGFEWTRNHAGIAWEETPAIRQAVDLPPLPTPAAKK